MSDVRCRTQLAAQTTRYWVKLPEPTKTVVSDQVSVPNVTKTVTEPLLPAQTEATSTAVTMEDDQLTAGTKIFPGEMK
ncbi:hypothetical protein Tco_0838152 [Tanacetum coccineum]|uniref:Uncharacterized protein n=1 Tax=Tanacetum coccineum TaxID=301880 RepID=A0ABQ5AM10_9ASTR